MAGITQEVHPYQPNVTKPCSLQSFSPSQFFTELHGSFYIFPIRGSVPSVAEKINKKVSGKNLNLTLKIGIFCFKIFQKSQKRRLCEANQAPQNAFPKFLFVSILQDFPLATSWYTSFVLEVLSSWRNLLNKIVRFQDFSLELFEYTFCQKFRKQTILFCKLLLLYGTYRKIGVYHDIANGKSYKIETKRNFGDAFQGA